MMLSKTNRRIIAATLSVFLSLFTLFYIEAKGYSDDLRQFYFGNLQDMGQVEKVIGKGYFKTIQSVMALLFVYFVAYVCFFAIFFEIIALAYFIATSRWRNPKVFVSFKYESSDNSVNTNNIANEVKNALEKKGFHVLFFKYNRETDHDTVNYEIQKLLRRADAMVVIPDPYKPSYVNAEILCAVNDFKPVYIIKHTPDQRLPDTANSGHTVLLLDKLKKEKYQPLRHILQYVHRVWHKRLFIIGLPPLSFLSPFMYLEDDDGSFLKIVFVFALITAALIFFKVPVLIVLLAIKVIIVAIGGIGAYVTIDAIFENIKFEKIIKQSMINSGNTYDHFEEAGFSKKILGCVDRIGLAK